MSTMPVPEQPARPIDAVLEERRQARRLRAAACQQRLRMATDALAAVDLLLGMNWSTTHVGQQVPQPKPSGAEPRR